MDLGTLMTFVVFIPLLAIAVKWWVNVGRWCLHNWRGFKGRVERMKSAAQDAWREGEELRDSRIS
jgi:hypothetical protein